MKARIAQAALLAAGAFQAVSASAVVRQLNPNRTCENYRINVTITSDNLEYGLPYFEDNFDVADFIDVVSARNAPDITTFFAGDDDTNATYTIAGTFCQPARGRPDRNKNTVLIATHDTNFDRSYWDPLLDDRYSFVDFVVNKGYSIFYYDRLGVGDVSGYVAQRANQVAILTQLVTMIQAGRYTGTIGRPDQTVLVGHGFGSVLSFEAVGNNATLVDALVLTGFSVNAADFNPIGFLETAEPRIAAFQRPFEWGGLDTASTCEAGYLTPVDVYAEAALYFKAPDYEECVAFYTERTKAPFAILEYLTTFNFDIDPLDFAGPTLLLSGEYDFIWCMSDCDGILDDDATADIFPDATPFQGTSYAGAGHAINYHLNALGAFNIISNFLGNNLPPT
ncbi:hypothetical protein QBC46DRAFT_421654 [Diplogelasinospora grovesii]|uniref:AB hydrolase-1 domain-containing protein n=1 Tax=Diplogelasinospora grovesii TaxID=303347 RepID=A0AAN6ND75_9PEZI|nr:hypothetical protein QBC46DRAFT_421654 [Diplogelasinospora grovesii]